MPVVGLLINMFVAGACINNNNGMLEMWTAVVRNASGTNQLANWRPALRE